MKTIKTILKTDNYVYTIETQYNEIRFMPIVKINKGKIIYPTSSDQSIFYGDVKQFHCRIREQLSKLNITRSIDGDNNIISINYGLGIKDDESYLYGLVDKIIDNIMHIEAYKNINTKDWEIKNWDYYDNKLQGYEIRQLYFDDFVTRRNGNFLGASALRSNITGSDNIAVGMNSGTSITT